jgi:hypothetical protein
MSDSQIGHAVHAPVGLGGASGRWWSVAESEMLTHSVGLKCVPAQPG